jgi:hypothetical protein
MSRPGSESGAKIWDGFSQSHHGKADRLKLLSVRRQLPDVARASTAKPSGVHPRSLGDRQGCLLADDGLQPGVLIEKDPHRLERAVARWVSQPLEVRHRVPGWPLQESSDATLQGDGAERPHQRRMIRRRHRMHDAADQQGGY